LINPQQHIRKSSMAIHGITQEMVEDAPTEEEVLPKIMKFIGDAPIVAHNAIFDYSFINEANLRVFGHEISNPRIDTQQLFKEICPDIDAPSLDALTERFNVKLTNHYRAMGDAMGHLLSYLKLKKIYLQKSDWQSKQLCNIDYLLERYLRIQQSISTLQAEIQDLKSIFKLYFDLGGQPVTAETGETLVYQSKQSFSYELSDVRAVLEEVGAFDKAVKLNNGFIDRLCNGFSISEENRQIIKDARRNLSETRTVHILKSGK